MLQVTTCPTAAQLQPVPVPDDERQTRGQRVDDRDGARGRQVADIVDDDRVAALSPDREVAGVASSDREIEDGVETGAGSLRAVVGGLRSPAVATVALLVTLGSAPAATPTVSVMSLVTPEASGPALVQVTV